MVINVDFSVCIYINILSIIILKIVKFKEML